MNYLVSCQAIIVHARKASKELIMLKKIVMAGLIYSWSLAGMVVFKPGDMSYSQGSFAQCLLRGLEQVGHGAIKEVHYSSDLDLLMRNQPLVANSSATWHSDDAALRGRTQYTLAGLMGLVALVVQKEVTSLEALSVIATIDPSRKYCTITSHPKK